ncbi:hypothetical protein TNIN_283841 [Trichonephila inaurata madagascariensis]|uniref:Uncharacterized protein n=1 Tax=Trichonephila inaurata madagascariensis TaxID=2747483 RepID=A0A8X7CLB8_9ARAC|nr:hypothetical protein TNIN_283841 [Trichonephila inaurata madagascariensis]
MAFVLAVSTERRANRDNTIAVVSKKPVLKSIYSKNSSMTSLVLMKNCPSWNGEREDNESDAIDIDQCDNEIESEEEVNEIEFSRSEDEDLRYIAPNKKGARVTLPFQ